MRLGVEGDDPAVGIEFGEVAVERMVVGVERDVANPMLRL